MQVSAIEDCELFRVGRFIREHACEGIDVNDGAEFTPLSGKHPVAARSPRLRIGF